MRFADLKNDFVFRRIFGQHPDVLIGLLNDLLDRRGERTIEAIEYLEPEQAPHVIGAKLSIVDVKCRDRSGGVFVVEMQLIHVMGFINRVVYNACNAYVSQLKEGEPYSTLADVVTISICDFALWPDRAQEAQGKPRVPLVSRWSMTEQASGATGIQQVEYVFLELPKLPERPPETGVEVWASLFKKAPTFTEIPPQASTGPYRKALDLANEATFTPGDMEAYRKVFDEIEQARQLARDAEARGEARGEIKATAKSLLRVLAARGITVDEATRERIEGCGDLDTLNTWLQRAAVAASAVEVVASGS